jgi:hypothetical protein
MAYTIVSALQTGSPDFNPSSTKKKKREEDSALASQLPTVYLAVESNPFNKPFQN